MAGVGSPGGPDRLRSVLEATFPGLQTSRYEVTSPADRRYNCLAWAAGVTDLWWDPGPDGYWPSDVPREPTVEGARAAYATLGYTTATTEHLEHGWQKIAIFIGTDGRLTHAARQLDEGTWTSKLGRDIDLSHVLRALEGPCYGRVALVLGRRKSTSGDGWWSRFFRRLRRAHRVFRASLR